MNNADNARSHSDNPSTQAGPAGHGAARDSEAGNRAAGDGALQPGGRSVFGQLSRRDFLYGSAMAAAAGLTGCAAGDRTAAGLPPGDGEAAAGVAARAAAGERIRVGVIGAGYRGTGAAIDCVRAGGNIEIVAIGDLFRDRVEESRKTLAKEVGEHLKVTDDTCFSGFDNHKGVLSVPLDLVILAAPPGFRPAHFEAAVDAGKHVFMEKPVAVDPVGVRRVMAAADKADARGLCVVAGTQRRHDPIYVETMQRIRDGAIGEIIAAQCYWNQEDLWHKAHQPEWSDMEWQCRNWLYFTWLSGDHIVEQHVHNLDVINWALGGPPVKAVGMGGRSVRTGPEFGHIFDHFAVEYEYASGVRVLSMCRQQKGTSTRVGERLVGTRGTANPFGRIDGPEKWEWDKSRAPVNPYEQEHAALISAIRTGRRVNEGRQIAESTLTAILGRMCAYTGREIKYDWVLNSSRLDLTPARMEFGPLPVAEVASPGRTALV